MNGETPEEVIKKLITKMYKDGVESAKESIKVLIEVLKVEKNKEKIGEILEDIKKRLTYEDNV